MKSILAHLTSVRIAVFRSRIAYGIEGSCYLWQGGRCGDYGSFYCGPVLRAEYAHRISWELAYGPMGDGQLVCHDCPGGDNPLCCNPEHLFLGSQKANLQDASQKGMMASGNRHGTKTRPDRVARGQRNGGARLTEEQVLQMHRLARHRQLDYAELAGLFGVKPHTVYSILRGARWSHLLDGAG